MAKYNITHTCGHQAVHQLVGPTSDRKRRETWLETTLCSECYRAEIDARRAEASQIATAEAKEYEMPALTGTEKQVAWAERIRMGWMHTIEKSDANEERETDDAYEIHSVLRHLMSPSSPLSAAGQAGRDWLKAQGKGNETQRKAPLILDGLRPSLYAWAAEQVDAHFWIDFRDLLTSQAGKALEPQVWAVVKAVVSGESVSEESLTHLQHEAEKAAEEARYHAQEAKRLAREAQQESTVLTASPVGALVAEISVMPGELCVAYPEKDETLRQIVRKLSFQWSGAVWKRITKNTEDRAVEVAHKLLAAGFHIRLSNPELRRRAVAGEYESENTRRVAALVSGPYKGKFAVTWDRSEKWYDTVKRVPGTRWQDGKAVIPAESFEELQDFAETHGFYLTSGAQALIEEQKALIETALRVTVAPPAAPEPALDAPPVLTIPTEVEVPDHLRDDLDLPDDLESSPQ